MLRRLLTLTSHSFKPAGVAQIARRVEDSCVVVERDLMARESRIETPTNLQRPQGGVLLRLNRATFRQGWQQSVLCIRRGHEVICSVARRHSSCSIICWNLGRDA